MIDFKRELQNYKRVKTVAELSMDENTGDYSDFLDIFEFIIQGGRAVYDEDDTPRHPSPSSSPSREDSRRR